MKQTVNTFTGGLNTDSDISMLPSNSYREAVNFRLTDFGQASSSSSGALVTIKGHQIVSNLQVIGGKLVGGTNIGSKVILFYRNGEVSNIYESSLDPVNISNNGLRLIYSDVDSLQKLEFTESVSIISRYENESIQKVYWAIPGKPIRCINIVENYMGVEADRLDLVPVSLSGTVTITKALSGGKLKSGRIQYFYSLFNKNGTETGYSALSKMYSLTVENDSVSGAEMFQGSDKDEVVNKSLEVSLTNLDTSFSYVRLYSVYYSDPTSLPEVKLIAEQKFLEKNVSIIDTGESITYITIEELNSFGSSEFSAKLLEVKDNILFAADIIEDNFDVDFDARAYRYNSGGTARVYANASSNSPYINISQTGSWTGYNSDGSIISGMSGTNWSIPKEYACMNFYNRLNSDPAYQAFKFRFFFPWEGLTGLTYGGRGRSVSYAFKNEFNVMHRLSDTDFYTPLVTGRVNTASSAPSFKRYEVYRFGIVFFSKKMKPSPVKWIGDIKMPPVAPFRSNANMTIDSHPLYPYFTVDLSTMSVEDRSKISGFQIVRVKRGNGDKSIICSGLVSRLAPIEGGTKGTYDVPVPIGYGERDKRTGYLLSPEITAGGLKLEDYSGLSLRFSFGSSVAFNRTPSGRRLVNNANFKHYSVDADEVFKDPDGEGMANDLKSIISVWNGSYIYNANPSPVDPSEAKEVAINHIITAKYPVERFRGKKTIGSGASSYVFTNRSRTSRGVGGGPGGGDGDHTAYYSGTCAPFQLAEDMGNNTTSGAMYLYSYFADVVRDVFISRYGGSTYEARQYNKYIASSDLIRVTSPNTTLYKDVVADRGDTYIGMYQHMECMYDGNGSGIGNSADDFKRTRQTMVMFPIESSIDLMFMENKPLRHMFNENLWVARHDSNSRAGIQELASVGVTKFPSFYPEDLGDLYRYNPIYSQEGDYPEFRPSVETETIVDRNAVKVFASEKKLNGELIDSWANFKANNFIEVDSTYGSINALKVYNNRLYFWQDTAFGVLGVNERSLIADGNLGGLVIGTGGVLERYDYISNKIGVATSRSLTVDTSGVYWYDFVNKHLLRYSDSLRYLDIEKQIRAYVRSLNMDEHLIVYSDPVNKEILFVIPTANKTLVYNQLADCFSGVHTYAPNVLFIDSFTGVLYSVPKDGGSNGRIWQHDIDGIYNLFYEQSYASFVDIVVNPEFPYMKTFDTISFSTEYSEEFDKTPFNSITAFTSDQSSSTVKLEPVESYMEVSSLENNVLPLYNKEKEWHTYVPRNANKSGGGTDFDREFKERLRDRYMRVRLGYYDSNIELNYDRRDKPFKVPYVKTSYRYSIR